MYTDSEIYDMYSCGKSTREIAVICNCDKKKICNILKKNKNIVLRSNISIDIHKDKIISMYNSNKKVSEIATEIGCDTKTIYSFFKRNNVELIKKKKKEKVSKITETIKENINSMYELGKTINEIRQLTGFGYDRVRKCIRYDEKLPNSRSGINNKRFTGYKDISGDIWSKIRHGAKKRNIEFNISIEYAWSKWEEQNGLCAYSGDKLIFGKDSIRTASLDRIDSKLPYIEGNTQWIHKQINKMQWGVPDELFISLCESVHDVNKKNKDNSAIILDGNYISNNWFNRFKANAKYRKIHFDISIDDLNNLYLLQGGKCYLSGMQLNICDYGYNNTTSIDRIDSNGSYTIDNIRLCNKHINRMKLNLDINLFINICSKIAIYQRSKNA